MKRSGQIRLVLLGGLSAGAFTGCAPADKPVRISPEAVYANDTHVPGAGYYHAPFQAFFPRPYNSYDPQLKRYYFGGQWGPAPHRSIVNVSSPTPAAAQLAQAARTDGVHAGVTRGGFGRSSRHHSVWS